MIAGFARLFEVIVQPMFAVFSTSLSRDSRSRIMARAAAAELRSLELEVELFDLAEKPLPACDAGSCYGDPNAIEASALIQRASGILIAAPVYNYDFGSSAKGLIELTGKVWTDKVVGFLCAAGGYSSYMAPMQLANSLMLDFRTLVLPKFVYATGDQFQGDQISELKIEGRISELVEMLVKVAAALESD